MPTNFRIPSNGDEGGLSRNEQTRPKEGSDIEINSVLPTLFNYFCVLWNSNRKTKTKLYSSLLAMMVIFQIVSSARGTGDLSHSIRLLTREANYESRYSSKPRILRMLQDGSVERIVLYRLRTNEKPEIFRYRRSIGRLSGNGDGNETRCSPMYDWQTAFHPTCNNMHEISFSQVQDNHLRLIASGYIRDVFELKTYDGARWALKTHQIRKKFSSYHMGGQTKDAIVSDMATSSNYVASIYGACGMSSLYEFSEDGTLRDNYQLLNRGERLRVALEVARGLTDIHSLGGGNYAPVIHNDIWARQFVKLNGRYQLNDFNTGYMVSWDEKNQLPCERVHSKQNTHFNSNHAPEKFMDKPKRVFDEKVDVYRIGNIFYQLLMNESKYKRISLREARKHILAGHMPELPRDVEKSTDVVVVGLKKAMRMCLVLDPEKRASAAQIVNYLERQVRKLNKESKEETEREWQISKAEKQSQ